MCRLILTSAALTLLVGTLTAQPPAAVRAPSVAQQASLLLNRGVQAELKLTVAQKEELASIVKKQQEALRQASEAKDDAAARQAFEAGEKALVAVRASLKEGQKSRLGQIDLQASSLRAFARPDVQKALGLTPTQLDDAKRLDAELSAEADRTFRAARDQEAFVAGQKKMAALGKAAVDKVVKAMSPDQRKTWKELTGPAFELKMDEFPPPPGAPAPGTAD